jgi:hypothetical protein
MGFKKEDTPSLTDGTLKEPELKKSTLEELCSRLKTINKKRESNPWIFPVITNAYFEDIIFKNVYLNEVKFINCKFENCTISDSNLAEVEFLNVSFKDVDFTGCDMKSVTYFKSKLKSVAMRRCIMLKNDFKATSFEDVFINDSSLDDSSARESNFDNVHLIRSSGVLLKCPEEGSFIGFKKIFLGNNSLLCKLEIPADAKRSSAFGRKCRCSKAKVLEIWGKDCDGDYLVPISRGYSHHDYTFEYKVGETIYPDSFDDNRWDECSNGIHFFITKQEAIDY